MTAPNMATLYRESLERVVGIVSGMSDDDRATTIAGTPKWCAPDVLAHLTGVAEDFLSRNMEGAPGEPWSAAQIERARGVRLDQLAEQWRVAGGHLADAIEAGQAPPVVVWDVLTHEGDLRETHRLGRLPDDAVDIALAPLCEQFASRYGGPGCVELHAADTSWTLGDGDPSLVVSVAPYELFRGMVSRRSTAQMMAWTWDGDASEVLQSITVFGLRDDDQPIP